MDDTDAAVDFIWNRLSKGEAGAELNCDCAVISDRDELREVLSELPDEAWQPIETAPKDGTVIDLWVRFPDGTGKRVPDGFWDENGYDFGPNRCDGKPGWAAANMGYDGCDGYADEPEDGQFATHWMPLPDPPSGSDQPPTDARK